MREEMVYGMRTDTFLADMPIDSREKKHIWRTEKEKKRFGKM